MDDDRAEFKVFSKLSILLAVASIIIISSEFHIAEIFPHYRDTMHLLSFIIFVPFMVTSIAEIMKCSDITTRRAIEKRGRQINLKCLENKEQLEKCNNRTAVDIAWQDFEQANENYFTKSDSCKEGGRKKRHLGWTRRFSVFDLGHDFERKLAGNRIRRNVHGTSDDKNEPELENDHSSDFRRFKRNGCLKDSGREKTRLLEKFAGACKSDTAYDRDKMNKSCKDYLGKLSKARHRAYNNYVTSFRLCYGPIS